MYGSPSNGKPNFGQQAPQAGNQQGPQQYSAGPTGAARPNSFGQQESQQYNSGPSSAVRPNAFGQQGSQQLSGPSGPSNFPNSQPQQYQSSLSGGPKSTRPQGPSQPQDASGYQYDRPQGGFSGNGNGNGQSQFRPQNRAPTSQGYSRPSGNNGVASPNGQGSFGASSSNQNSYGSAPQNSFASTGSNVPKNPNAIGSARPNANFGSTDNQGSSNGFNRPQAGSNGQGFRPQGQAPKSSMSDSGYEYNKPGNFGGQNNVQFGAAPQNGNSPFGGQQNKFNSNQGQGPKPGQFGAPRAPPSFSEEEGYKY